MIVSHHHLFFALINQCGLNGGILFCPLAGDVLSPYSCERELPFR